jgi:hypothetical protein
MIGFSSLTSRLVEAWCGWCICIIVEVASS